MEILPADVLKLKIHDRLIRSNALPIVADDIADCLIRASLRGIDSHGVNLLPGILRRARNGNCRLDAVVTPVVDEGNAIKVYEGDLAPGQHAGMVIARDAIDKAKAFGIGMACVRNSTHFGAAAPFIELIVDAGMVGIVGSNSTPSMAAFGAKFPNLGNNPLGFGAPVADDADLIADFSCGVMSFGRLKAIQVAGKPVPKDAFIKPTDVPQKGAVYEIADGLDYAALPFGGYKGASIAVLVEMLSGLISGGFFGMETEVRGQSGFQGPSHFAIAFSPMAFGVADYQRRMKAFVDGIRSGTSTVRLPGQSAAQCHAERSAEGIRIGEDLALLLASSDD